MNERIRELATEAGMSVEYLTNTKQIVLLEKFAALIAKYEQQFTNNAYQERNQLVALLSTLFPSGKAQTAIEGWDEEWHGCVYIDFPWGQASWHYHIDDGWMFEHLSPYTKPWNGHTTKDKYAAIAAATRDTAWQFKSLSKRLNNISELKHEFNCALF